MDKDFKAQLEEARPGLRLISPLTFFICLGYGFINLLLGVCMFFLIDESKLAAPIAVVAGVFTFKVWGIIFATLGLLKFWALYKNKWHFTRSLLLAGLVVKAFWAVALLLRLIEQPSGALLFSIWLFFAYIQAVTYIYFLPSPGNIKNDTK